MYDTETNQKIDEELAFDVDVKDINDNPPKFVKIPETVTVKENQEEGGSKFKRSRILDSHKI